jgi:hypothetical protein
MKNGYRITLLMCEGKRPLERYNIRWNDNIQIDLKQTWCDDMNWIPGS